MADMDRGTRTAALSHELIGFLRSLRQFMHYTMAEDFSGVKPSSSEPVVVPRVTDEEAVEDAIKKADQSACSIGENANCLRDQLQGFAAKLSGRGQAGVLNCHDVDCFRRSSDQYLNRLGADMATLFTAQQKLFGSFIFEYKCPADPCTHPAYSPARPMLSAQCPKENEAVKGAQFYRLTARAKEETEAVKGTQPYQQISPQLTRALEAVSACKVLVEDYSRRLDDACVEYHEKGKTEFPALSRADEEDTTLWCERALEVVAAEIPDAKERWASIKYPSNQYEVMVQRLRDLWVRRRNLFRVLESTLMSRTLVRAKEEDKADKGAEPDRPAERVKDEDKGDKGAEPDRPAEPVKDEDKADKGAEPDQPAERVEDEDKADKGANDPPKGRQNSKPRK